jgi:hypothetical protein
MFGVWVRDGHHAGVNGFDSSTGTGYYFVVYATSGVDTEPQVGLLQGDLVGLVTLIVLVAGLGVRDEMRQLVDPRRSKPLSWNS